jgi:hypothetical protein
MRFEIGVPNVAETVMYTTKLNRITTLPNLLYTLVIPKYGGCCCRGNVVTRFCAGLGLRCPSSANPIEIIKMCCSSFIEGIVLLWARSHRITTLRSSSPKALY